MKKMLISFANFIISLFVLNLLFCKLLTSLYLVDLHQQQFQASDDDVTQ